MDTAASAKIAELTGKLADSSAKIAELSAKVATLDAIYSNSLSWVAAIVGALTLVVAVGAAVSFAYIRSLAKSTAEAVAGDAAREVAERVANNHIQREWPAMITAHQALMAQAADADIAELISEAQPDDGEG